MVVQQRTAPLGQCTAGRWYRSTRQGMGTTDKPRHPRRDGRLLHRVRCFYRLPPSGLEVTESPLCPRPSTPPRYWRIWQANTQPLTKHLYLCVVIDGLFHGVALSLSPWVQFWVCHWDGFAGERHSRSPAPPRRVDVDVRERFLAEHGGDHLKSGLGMFAGSLKHDLDAVAHGVGRAVAVGHSQRFQQGWYRIGRESCHCLGLAHVLRAPAFCPCWLSSPSRPALSHVTVTTIDHLFHSNNAGGIQAFALQRFPLTRRVSSTVSRPPHRGAETIADAQPNVNASKQG